MIQIRSANECDARLVFNWANDSSMRKFSINSKKIEWSSHINWFNDKINSTSYLLIAENINGIPVGQIRFDHYENYYLIDFYVTHDFRGKGYGKLLLNNGMNYVVNEIENIAFKAMVNEKNTPSIKSFLAEGFNLRERELINDQIFLCYYKEYKIK
jgi:RimJ/RimL family protein N-acetyltransferase